MKFAVVFLLVLSWIGGGRSLKDGHLEQTDPNVCYGIFFKEVEIDVPCKDDVTKTCNKTIEYKNHLSCCYGYKWDMVKNECVPSQRQRKRQRKCPPSYTLTNDTAIVHCVPDCCLTQSCAEQPELCCSAGHYYSEQNKRCTPVCEEACVNAKCTGINTCKCLEGYKKTSANNVCYADCEACKGKCDNGTCQCPDGTQCFGPKLEPEVTQLVNCNDCVNRCEGGTCVCANGTECIEMKGEQAGVESTPTLAGIQMTWMMGGSVLILLLIVIAVVIRHIYRRNAYMQKSDGIDKGHYSSALYVLPNRLIPPAESECQNNVYDEPSNQHTMELLAVSTDVARL